MARFVQNVVRFRQALAKRVAAANKIGGAARTIAAVQRLVRIKFAVKRLQARMRARRLRSRLYAKRPELRAIAQRCALGQCVPGSSQPLVSSGESPAARTGGCSHQRSMKG